jgi:hypothetical protein
MNKTIKIRVMAEAEIVREVANEIAGALGELEVADDKLRYHELEVVEISKPYPCRAPEEDQARVYLTVVVKGQ